MTSDLALEFARKIRAREQAVGAVARIAVGSGADEATIAHRPSCLSSTAVS